MELVTALLIFVGLILLMLLPGLKPRARNAGLGLNFPSGAGQEPMPRRSPNAGDQDQAR